MEPAEYQKLIQLFRRGAILTSLEAGLSEGGRRFRKHLVHYVKREWPQFSQEEAGLMADLTAHFPGARGDLLFLRANSSFLKADYKGAALGYAEAASAYQPSCGLFTPELIQFNIYVLKEFEKDFSFRKEFHLLRSARKGAQQKGDFFLVALILNAYGNRAFERARYRRALRLFKLALADHERELRLTNYLDSLSNTVRAALRVGELREAERAINLLNERILNSGDLSFKARFDRVYAEYLFHVERFEESLTHLDFCLQADSVPFEKAQMMLLKAQILLSRNGVPVAEVESLLSQTNGFLKSRDLKDDTWIDYFTARASLELESGDVARSYQSVLRAEQMAYLHRNAELRAQVMLRKARINLLQGKDEQAARLVLEVLRVCDGLEFRLLTFEALRALNEPKLLAALEARELRELEPWLEQTLPPGSFSATRQAIADIRAWLKAARSGGGGPLRASEPRAAESDYGITVDTFRSRILQTRDGKSVEVTKTHLMTGRLLAELLRNPNRDLSLDHLHLKLWGGPVRNESHVQKLKTLVSRLRTELRSKSFPAEIESREYSTYRLVIDREINWSDS